MLDPSKPKTPMPVPVPNHELIRCIGEGSYGNVWIARNVMGSYRAVKVVHRSRFTDRRPYERELMGIEKFEPISRSHPGFMAILQIGINKDPEYFFYVMELGDELETCLLYTSPSPRD